jgi:NADPH:quinone reductase-like Zn-dependent oxidoreductase
MNTKLELRNNNSSTMQAARLAAFDTPLQIARVPRPQPAAHEVLVRVKSSGVNRLDVKIHNGSAAHARVQLPAILGIDLAGVVQQVGRQVSSFKVGDEVYGMSGGVGCMAGSLAEFATVDAQLLALKPRNFSMHEAAALPMIFITAWQGLVDKARLQAGQKVLVHGGAGGVGHIAVQLARAFGAQVFATGSRAHRETIENLGAIAIDYRSSAVEDYVAQYTASEGFDVVYDTVGGTTLDASFLAARRHSGHVVSCAGWGAHKLAPLSFRAATYSGVFTLLPLLCERGEGRAHHGEIMRQATRMVEAGQIRLRLDQRRFALADVNRVHQLMESRSAEGKLVIDIAD